MFQSLARYSYKVGCFKKYIKKKKKLMTSPMWFEKGQKMQRKVREIRNKQFSNNLQKIKYQLSSVILPSIKVQMFSEYWLF